MRITPQFTRLHSGENKSRLLEIEVNEALWEKTVKLAFVTPMGNIFVSDALSMTEGRATFAVTSSLLDGKGILLCQIIVSDEEGFVCKSTVLELPVFASVDDMSCPVVTDEGLKSLALIFEALSGKADIVQLREEYYTRADTDNLLSLKCDAVHNHDGSYYTEAEADALLFEKSDKSHLHEGVYLTREEIEKIATEKAENANSHEHDDRYYTIDEITSLLSSKCEIDHKHDGLYYPRKDVDAALSGKSNKDHYHDDLYYRKTQLDTILSGKSSTSHNHDSAYYTKSQTDTLLSGKSTSTHKHDADYYRQNVIDSMLSGKSDKSHIHTEYVKADTGRLSSLVNDTGFVTSAYVSGLLEGKQDTLQFDEVPAENSRNPVYSGGVFAAVRGLNGLTLVVSDTVPTVDDRSVITFVTEG